MAPKRAVSYVRLLRSSIVAPNFTPNFGEGLIKERDVSTSPARHVANVDDRRDSDREVEGNVYVYHGVPLPGVKGVVKDAERIVGTNVQIPAVYPAIGVGAYSGTGISHGDPQVLPVYHAP